MAETVSACYLGLPAEDQKRIMKERIADAPADIESMVAVRLCDRDECSLSVAGIIRAGFTPTHMPHLMDTRDADLSVELAPDCIRFQDAA